MKLTATVLLFFAFTTCATAAPPDIDALLNKLDRLYRSETSYSHVTMQVTTPHYERTLQMEIWTEGLEKTLIRIRSPQKEKNSATLRIHKEMWNYLPRVNKTIKIPPSMMMSSWMGSDFTNDDLVKESSMRADYNARYLPSKPEHLEIELVPKENKAIVWAKIIVTLDAKDLLPISEKFYDERNQLTRTIYFKNVKTIGTRQVPVKLELINAKKEKHSTILIYDTLNFNPQLPADTFSLRQLRSHE